MAGPWQDVPLGKAVIRFGRLGGLIPGQIREKVLGPKHLGTAQSLNSLALRADRRQTVAPEATAPPPELAGYRHPTTGRPAAGRELVLSGGMEL